MEKVTYGCRVRGADSADWLLVTILYPARIHMPHIILQDDVMDYHLHQHHLSNKTLLACVELDLNDTKYSKYLGFILFYQQSKKQTSVPFFILL